MRRRDFIFSTLAATIAAAAQPLGFASPRAATRKILIAGGAYGTPFIRYMAELTGKPRPKLLYLPTASADSATSTLSWYRSCAPLNVEPSDQASFIASTRQDKSWEEVFLSVDGIVLGGASAGSLCWFEEGTTDSRPKELTIVQGLGFLKGSHSPHYDAEKDRRPLYQQLIASGKMKPGYACDNNAGIYFEDNEVKRVVSSRAGAKAYYVSIVNGKVAERVLEPEMIS